MTDRETPYSHAHYSYGSNPHGEPEDLAPQHTNSNKVRSCQQHRLDVAQNYLITARTADTGITSSSQPNSPLETPSTADTMLTHIKAAQRNTRLAADYMRK
jgi:hypothetical protein